MNGVLLRERVSRDILVAPGAANALTARLIEEAGFQAVYATGAGIANSHFAMPDVGLLTMTEVVAEVRRIVDAVDVPVIADADTGYGGPLNVTRTVKEMEDVGVAAIQLEDQVTPKRCGHFDNKRVVSTDEMLRRIDAALNARENPNTIIIGRTDARQSMGLDEAIRRGISLQEAGVDLVFVEAPESTAELRSIADSVPGPLVANMVEGGRTPLVPAEELDNLGYRLVIYANTALRLSMQAVVDGLRVLASDGTTESILTSLMPWDERQRIVRLPEYVDLEERLEDRRQIARG